VIINRFAGDRQPFGFTVGRGYASGARSTAHHYSILWDWDGTLEGIHHALYVAVREQAGRDASPSAAIIDSQSAKAAQNVWAGGRAR
jgi:hypothetical protein